ncbi:hypothetical protein BKA70DRAFT_1574439 [Coprinopsis sp. MPI-PUGE-AT-0042]|nr:hypothetical protein BKA70DRAFT_1574439 [Coprinopsis sp. MPI-PUGE-AT-0042]
MPRTRNENGYGSEKENTSRAPRTTRSRAAGRTVLGAVAEVPTPKAASSSKAKSKGKPPGKPTLTKVEKLPLQDITLASCLRQNLKIGGTRSPRALVHRRTWFSHLPLRGRLLYCQRAWAICLLSIVPPRVDGFTHPLFPHHPPSLSSHAHAHLPVLSRSPTPIADPLSRRLFEERREAPAVSDAWKEFDFAVPDSDARSRPRATPRNSDPFGFFFALERKLEAEREEEAVGAIVLVKDTSPGLEYTDDHAEGTQRVFPLSAPITTHASQAGRYPRRESFTSNADHLFSTPASSCPSSPSPTKPQAPSSKRKAADFDAIHDEPAGSTPHVPRQPKRVKKVVVEVEVVEEQEAKPVLRRSQRGHKKPVEEEDAAEPQPGPSRKFQERDHYETKKSAPAILPEDDSDAEEKRELERQARLAYFRELDEYKVETENVYVI